MSVNQLQEPVKIPPEPGSYILLLQLAASKAISVGRLGIFSFPAGAYLYLGTAFGPGGLAARLKRHISGAGRLHWHIDYLRREATPVQVWYIQNERREHTWARAFQGLAGASVPAPRFGASDCRCSTHLFHFSDLPACDLAFMAIRKVFGSDLIVQQKLR
jgi:Uri superfamily endonuclease